MNATVHRVLVQFSSNGKEYSYLADMDVNVGDMVVVEVQSEELKIAQVSQADGLTPHQIKLAHKWIICKIDLEKHEARKKARRRAQEIGRASCRERV